jgi:hypothetical protein
VLSSVLDVASGSAVPVAMLPLPISSIILSAPDTRKFNFTRSQLWETRSSNATTVAQRMFSCSDSFPLSPTRLLSFCAANLALNSLLEGHELGYFEMATSYRRPFISTVACICSYRCRAASCQTPYSPMIAKLEEMWKDNANATIRILRKLLESMMSLPLSS